MSKRNFDLKEFEKYDFQAWQAKLSDDLHKVGQSNRKLVRTTLDGITPKPLYCGENSHLESEAQNPPGFYPYARGFHNLCDKQLKIQQRFNALDKEDLKVKIERASAHGVDKFVLNYDESSKYFLGALSRDDLKTFDEIEKEIYLDFDFGEYYFPLLAKIEAYDFSNRTNLSLRVDPIGHFLEYGKSMFSMEEHEYFVEKILHCHHNLKIDRFFNFSSQVVLNAGANNIQEIAYLLSNAYFWIKKLGLKDAKAMIPYMHFTIGVDSEVFHNIAKVRAFRIVWSRLMNILDFDDVANKIGVSTRFNENWISSLDPWMNMLRNTAACFSSICSNVDFYMPIAHDEKRRYFFDNEEHSHSWSDRIAQNTVHLLNKESHLGQVMDPAGGSWAIEDLTIEMAEKIWGLFQKINETEDFFKFIKENKIHEMITPIREESFKRIKKRKIAISGVNQYANLEDSLIGERPIIAEVKSYHNDTESKMYVDLVKKVRDHEFELQDVISLLKNEAQIGHIINIFKAHSESENIEPLERFSKVAMFEELRARVQTLLTNGLARPKCYVVGVGSQAQLSARMSFCKDYFEVIEMEVIESVNEELVLPENIKSSDVICLVSLDADYKELFEDGLDSKMNFKNQFIAGRPTEENAEMTKKLKLKPIHVGQDIYEVLNKLVISWEGK